MPIPIDLQPAFLQDCLDVCHQAILARTKLHTVRDDNIPWGDFISSLRGRSWRALYAPKSGRRWQLNGRYLALELREWLETKGFIFQHDDRTGATYVIPPFDPPIPQEPSVPMPEAEFADLRHFVEGTGKSDLFCGTPTD